jgi:hypothetical protein
VSLTLPAGTLVEVTRARYFTEIMVVERETPLILRPATAWERFRYWWHARRTGAAEMAAAVDAVHEIERISQGAKA